MSLNTIATDTQRLVNLTRWRINYASSPGGLGILGGKTPAQDAVWVMPVIVATGDDEDRNVQGISLIPIGRRANVQHHLVLPEAEDGVWLLVEPDVAALYPERPDLLFPIGRQDGTEMWATHLIVANPEMKDMYRGVQPLLDDE